MLVIYIPYPFSGLSTTTCVTEPTILSPCIIGDPLIPCTMPPVLFKSSVSVISNNIFLVSLNSLILVILIEYSLIVSLSITVNILASPKTGLDTLYNFKLSVFALKLPNIPLCVFLLILPYTTSL